MRGGIIPRIHPPLSVQITFHSHRMRHRYTGVGNRAMDATFYSEYLTEQP